MPTLEDYRKIVGDEVINTIYKKAEKLSGKHIVTISSTHQAGGVAEMLNTLVFLFNEIGIDFGWRILHGNPDFFTITKKFHNALQGDKINLSAQKHKIYYETNRNFSRFTHLYHDLVIVHDPQPLPLIEFYENKQPWIFRCHVDLSHPNPEAWNYLKQYIKKYDRIVVSMDKYKKNLSVPQSIIYPAIDPLATKNKFISEKIINKYLEKNGINLKKPIISYISRYDKWKDPEGLIKIFNRVKKEVDCQLVLLGNLASDDPEGVKVYNRIIKKYGDRGDIKILLNVDANDLVVNSLQRKSAVFVHKAIREGFGLVVAEALYKGTPVVASKIGGIPAQVIDGKNGFLYKPDDIEGFSNSIIKILKDKKLKTKLGEYGKEHIKENFLITRLMLDWLNIFEMYLF